jgi:hypothetical protein
MAEQVLQNIQTATESAIQTQQEWFRKWASFWTGAPPSPGGSVVEQLQAVQKKWAEAIAELFQKQREMLETQFNAGLKLLEDASRVLQAKDPEQFRAKAIEYWQKSFESVRQLAEGNLREFQAAVVKCSQPVSEKPAAEKPA